MGYLQFTRVIVQLKIYYLQLIMVFLQSVMAIVKREIHHSQFTMDYLQFTMVIVQLKILYLQLIITLKKYNLLIAKGNLLSEIPMAAFFGAGRSREVFFWPVKVWRKLELHLTLCKRHKHPCARTLAACLR